MKSSVTECSKGKSPKSTVVQFSLVQAGISALRKANMHSITSLRSFPNVAFETVPMFVWLTMALSRPFKEDHLAVSLSTLLSGIPKGSCWSLLSSAVLCSWADSLWSPLLCTVHWWKPPQSLKSAPTWSPFLSSVLKPFWRRQWTPHNWNPLMPSILEGSHLQSVASNFPLQWNLL